ncbi:hypothetical protein D3C80_1521330 [compost metagenome]
MVLLEHLDLGQAAVAAGQIVVLQALVEGLDALVGQGVAGDDDLEAVVVRRIVAAGDHHPAACAEHVGGEVQHRGRHHADVGDVAAAVLQAADQRAGQFRAGQAAVAADHHPGLAAGEAFRADGAADPVGGVGGQAVADHTADVVGAEDPGRQVRGVGAVHRGRVLHAGGR